MELPHHIIQIEPDTPTKNLYITKDESANLQKPIIPTPSIHSQPEQVLSASALEKQYKEMVDTVSYTRDSKMGSTVLIQTKQCEPASPDCNRLRVADDASKSTSGLSVSNSKKETKLISASLEVQMAPPTISTSSEAKSSERARLTSSRSSSPISPSARYSRVSPSSPTPSMASSDKGKSKVTGKIVSGWL